MHHGIGLQTAWQIPRITPAQLEVFGSYEFLLLQISVGIAPGSPHHLLIAGYISTLHRLLQADVSWQVLHKLLSAFLLKHSLLRLQRLQETGTHTLLHALRLCRCRNRASQRSQSQHHTCQLSHLVYDVYLFLSKGCHQLYKPNPQTASAPGAKCTTGLKQSEEPLC